MTTDEPTQSNESNGDSEGSSRSRREILKLAGTVSAATLSAGALTSTAAASGTTPESAEPSTTETTQFSPEEADSHETEPMYIPGRGSNGCIVKTGSPGVTIYEPCIYDAYAAPLDYAKNILKKHPALAECHTALSISTEIQYHDLLQHGESITLGCGGGD